LPEGFSDEPALDVPGVFELVLPAVRGRSSTLVLGAIAVGAQATALTAHAAETVRLAWARGEGADTCLGEAELVARVRSRLGSDPFDDAAERVIEGHALPAKSGFRAELLVRGPDGAVLGRRSIEAAGEDCVALGQAVTLAVVLTIDPNAPLRDDESRASFPIDGPPVPSLPPPSAPPSPPLRPLPAAAPPCPACPPRPVPLGLSAGVVGVLGLLPRVALGAEIEGAYPALPSGFVVGMRWLPSVDSSDGHIAVGITSGKVGYCGALVDSRLSLSLCGVLEAGVTTVVALDLEPVSPGDYPYMALGGGPRLVWPTRSTVSFQAGLLGLVPLFRHQFQVEISRNPGFQASPVGAVGFVGLGFQG
jgi:hypothetical protein